VSPPGARTSPTSSSARGAARREHHRGRDRRAGRGIDGCAAAPEGYLQKLRDICTKHGILLIFDEVITGFGRLGQPFAAQASA
jgi:hypothetical protein